MRLKPAISDSVTRTKTGRSATPTCSGRAATRKHPSQLWYDVHGNLLGADFSVLQSSSPEPPSVWGVSYRRWTSFRAHVHYILAGPNGTETYGATSVKKFAAAGGDIDDPRAATVVSMGKAHSVAAGKARLSLPFDLGSHRMGETQSQRRLRRQEPARRSFGQRRKRTTCSHGRAALLKRRSRDVTGWRNICRRSRERRRRRDLR